MICIESIYLGCKKFVDLEFKSWPPVNTGGLRFQRATPSRLIVILSVTKDPVIGRILHFVQNDKLFIIITVCYVFINANASNAHTD